MSTTVRDWAEHWLASYDSKHPGHPPYKHTAICCETTSSPSWGTSVWSI